MGGIMRAILTMVAVAAVLAPAAGAATPQQIYADLADNGRLDAQYSPQDLQAALRSAVVQAYGDESAQEELEGALAGTGGPAGGTAGGILPFTGLDLALLSGFGVALVLVGVGMRRVRPRRVP